MKTQRRTGGGRARTAPRLRVVMFALAVALLGSVSAVHGQRATERYIPIGKSPGLSGKYTTIGTVDGVDIPRRIIEMSDTTASYTVHCTEDTKFWLDRTKIRLTNLTGTLADCEVGRLLEVKYVDNDRNGRMAEWVKIQILEAD
jgi:hypothetical protein